MVVKVNGQDMIINKKFGISVGLVIAMLLATVWIVSATNTSENHINDENIHQDPEELDEQYFTRNEATLLTKQLDRIEDKLDELIIK